MSEIIHGDSFEYMASMENESIDMILTDPPYGTINQDWDVKIDVPLMMAEFFRIAKQNAPIVITCQQPFATDLMNAGRKYFREELIWNKQRCLGFFNANKKHLRQHELVFVFSKSMNDYTPQMTAKKKPERVEWGGGIEAIYRDPSHFPNFYRIIPKEYS